MCRVRHVEVGGDACMTSHQEEMHEAPLSPSFPPGLPQVVAAPSCLPPAEAVGGLLCTLSSAEPLVEMLLLSLLFR